MIAEEDLSDHDNVSFPEISIDGNPLIYYIINSIKESVPFFKSYIIAHVHKKSLNEDELTQIFVEQIDIQLRKLNYPFGVKNQYRDIYHGSSGFSDFYFHPIEEGKLTASIFSVESKRLSAPTKDREKEYVLGINKNGGIERYKIEKHGRGLSQCGMIGFIENEDFNFWLKAINKWIINLSETNTIWNKTELLSEIENNIEFSYLNSEVNTTTSRKMLLHHIWINNPINRKLNK